MLLESLKEFGLDPRDWRILLKKSNCKDKYQAYLENIKDPNLFFKGECSPVETNKQIKLHWHYLSLV